jgi:hypothetical protein
MKREILYILSFIYVLAVISVLSACESRRSGREKTEPVEKATETTTVVATLPPPVINVYLENSGSMDGYVNGNTDFKQSVYNYLSDIKISDIATALNLFYINSETIPQGSDIAGFIQTLNPNTFRMRGGNRGTSDISNLINTILSKTDTNHVSILISDCIFSPEKGTNAAQYLINQQIGIKTNVAEYLKKHKHTSIIIYQLSSQFNGKYFDAAGNPTLINDRRPFYICLIGNTKYLTELRNKIPETKFIGSGVQHIFSISPGNVPVDYAVRINSGDFELDKQNPKTHIIEAKKISRGRESGNFTCTLDANLSVFLLDEAYLSDAANYQLSDKDFRLTISKSPAGARNYTHSLKLSSAIIKPGNLSVKLLIKIPQWVEEMNDDTGDINEPGAMQKTFGIKYIIHGIYEAYTSENNYYTNIKISIN